MLLSLLPLADAAAATTTTGSTSSWLTLIPLVALVAAFYFFVIRPQKKTEKKNKDMLAALKVGDLITTIGGVYGRITDLQDDVVTIEVGAEKTKLVFARWAIRNVDTPKPAEASLEAKEEK